MYSLIPNLTIFVFLIVYSERASSQYPEGLVQPLTESEATALCKAEGLKLGHKSDRYTFKLLPKINNYNGQLKCKIICQYRPPGVDASSTNPLELVPTEISLFLRQCYLNGKDGPIGLCGGRGLCLSRVDIQEYYKKYGLSPNNYLLLLDAIKLLPGLNG